MKTTINIILTIIQTIIALRFWDGVLTKFEDIHFICAILYVLITLILIINNKVKYE